LVFSPIVDIPTANLSSSEEASEGFKFTSSIWRSCCIKSAVLAATCLVLVILVSILIPRLWEKQRSTLAELPTPV
jgi:hypothetical protein